MHPSSTRLPGDDGCGKESASGGEEEAGSEASEWERREREEQLARMAEEDERMGREEEAGRGSSAACRMSSFLLFACLLILLPFLPLLGLLGLDLGLLLAPFGRRSASNVDN